MNANCDIVIIGGGPVGAALALALRDSGLRIHLLEARKAEHASADTRALALSYGSRLLLARLGVWSELANISPIRAIHISQKHSFGRTFLRATELGVPELGYVMPYADLQAQLQAALQQPPSPNPSPACGRGECCYLTDAVVTQLHHSADAATITYQHAGQEHTLTARLAVVADGGKLLEAAYPPQVHDYGQSAVIAHVTCSHFQTDTAFERFTMQGPVALLPFGEGYELVWTAAHNAAQDMLQWSDADFCARLHQHFGDRAGEFLSVGKRACFPLRLKRAPGITLPHTVLLGNAAQTLHPVAGQGFNMGLRDAWELAQEILDSLPEAIGSEAMLGAYRRQRRMDHSGGIHFTDGLVRLFSNDLPLCNSARGTSLSVLDCLPGAKKFVARRMMFGANG